VTDAHFMTQLIRLMERAPVAGVVTAFQAHDMAGLLITFCATKKPRQAFER